MIHWSTNAEGQPVVERISADIFDYEHPGMPKVTLEIDVVDSRPIVVAVTIARTEGVASRDIRVPVDRYLQHVLAMETHPALGTGHLPDEIANSGKRRRRILTDAFLRAVADAYLAAGRTVSGVTPDVDPRFHASDSQKFRWIKAARERGFIDEEG